jgi:hypothetical protein
MGSLADLDIAGAQTQKAPGRLAKGLWDETPREISPVIFCNEQLLVTRAAKGTAEFEERLPLCGRKTVGAASRNYGFSASVPALSALAASSSL